MEPPPSSARPPHGPRKWQEKERSFYGNFFFFFAYAFLSLPYSLIEIII